MRRQKSASPTTVLFATQYLPIRPENDSIAISGTFKEINATAGNLLEACENALDQHIKETAAFEALSTSLTEFVNNADDAGATHIKINIEINTASQTLVIRIIDNGPCVLPESKIGSYDWARALFSISEKAPEDPNEIPQIKSRGQGLALACAQFKLQKNAGCLSLHRNEPTGAVIVITSSLAPQVKSDNVLVEMMMTLINSPNTTEAKIALLQSIPRHPWNRGFNEAKNYVLQKIMTEAMQAQNNQPTEKTDPIAIHDDELLSRRLSQRRLSQRRLSAPAAANPLTAVGLFQDPAALNASFVDEPKTTGAAVAASTTQGSHQKPCFESLALKPKIGELENPPAFVI